MGDLLDSLIHHRTGNQRMDVCTLGRTEGHLVVAHSTELYISAVSVCNSRFVDFLKSH